MPNPINFKSEILTLCFQERITKSNPIAGIQIIAGVLTPIAKAYAKEAINNVIVSDLFFNALKKR